MLLLLVRASDYPFPFIRNSNVVWNVREIYIDIYIAIDRNAFIESRYLNNFFFKFVASEFAFTVSKKILISEEVCAVQFQDVGQIYVQKTIRHGEITLAYIGHSILSIRFLLLLGLLLQFDVLEQQI